MALVRKLLGSFQNLRICRVITKHGYLALAIVQTAEPDRATQQMVVESKRHVYVPIVNGSVRQGPYISSQLELTFSALYSGAIRGGITVSGIIT